MRAAETVHGPRSGTKITKPSKITKPNVFFVLFVVFVAFVPERSPWAVSPQAQQPQQQQQGQQPTPGRNQNPTFRVGAHLVTVDAYPTREGRIIENLTPDDFEIFEDGKLQKVEQLEYIDYSRPLPDDDRSSVVSSREGLELAANSQYRVIVFVIDRQAFVRESWNVMRVALLDYLRSAAEPRDLIAMVTTDDPWHGVVFGRRLGSIEQEINNPEWLKTPYREDALVMAGCGMDNMLGRVRQDTTYSLLEGLVRVLGQIREDHSSIVFISSGISRAPVNNRDDGQRSLSLPKTGLVNGKIQRIGPDMHSVYCQQEKKRLNGIDFDRRFGDLTRAARASNVSFYPITIFGPQMAMPTTTFGSSGMGSMGPSSMGRGMGPRPTSRFPMRWDENMIDLAKDTNGFGIPPNGDVKEGLRRIAADVSTHYLLGYYTTNTKWDGKIRSIRVRLKRTGTEIRARRDYRAPSNEEISTLSAARKPGERLVPADVAGALSVLSRVRPSAQFHAYGAVAGNALTVVVEVPPLAVEAGRWSDGAGIDVIAEGPGGETIGMGRGRLAANGRATFALPLDGSKPPATMMVRLRAEGESLTERLTIGANAGTHVGDPLAFRSGPRGLAIPVASFVFSRDEKVKLDWRVLGPVEQFEARLLDRYGLPLNFKVTVEDQSGGSRHLIGSFGFSALGRGDYVLELTTVAGGKTEKRHLGFRVN